MRLAGISRSVLTAWPGGARRLRSKTGAAATILGAGSAAAGIADQIVAAMVDAGAAKPAARYAIWLVDSQGLVHTGQADLDPSNKPYAQLLGRVAEWRLARTDRVTLADVVRHVHPTVLVGAAAQP